MTSASFGLPLYTQKIGLGLEDQTPHQAAKVVYSNFPTPNATVTDNVDRANRIRQYMTSNYLTTRDQTEVLAAKQRSREMIMKKELLQQVPFTVQILQDKASAILDSYRGVGHYEGPRSGKKGYNYLETFSGIPRLLQPRDAFQRKLLIVGGVLVVIWWVNRR